MLTPGAKHQRGWTFKMLAAITSAAAIFGQPTLDLRAQPAKSTATAVAANKAQLAADLEAAIQLIEKDDFVGFIDKYCPVELLRRLRQQDLVDRAATVMAGQKSTKRQLLTLLKGIAGQSPKFDKSGGLATLEFDTSQGTIEEIPGELNVPESFDLKITGLGDNLEVAIAEASKLLEAGEFNGFVERIFPPSELARLQTADAKKTLLSSFKETPDLPKSMIADLNLLRGLKAELTEDGKVATYTIAADGPRPKRSIKFQLVASNWRLYDDSPRVVPELARQTKLRPGTGTKTILMERIGGNWRFIELPMLRMDAQ